MIEVEVKARALPDTLQKMLSLGAVFLGEENHHDIYFSSPLRDFRKSDEALRIRMKEVGSRLTYKGPKLDQETKSRKEITVKIDRPEEMQAILVSLGFTPSAVVRKRRTKYQLGDAILALDEVEDLGLFLEVEIAGGMNWDEQKEKVLHILHRLGLDESIRRSYLELLEEKGKGREI